MNDCTHDEQSSFDTSSEAYSALLMMDMNASILTSATIALLAQKRIEP